MRSSITLIQLSLHTPAAQADDSQGEEKSHALTLPRIPKSAHRISMSAQIDSRILVEYYIQMNNTLVYTLTCKVHLLSDITLFANDLVTGTTAMSWLNSIDLLEFLNRRIIEEIGALVGVFQSFQHMQNLIRNTHSDELIELGPQKLSKSDAIQDLKDIHLDLQEKSLNILSLADEINRVSKIHTCENQAQVYAIAEKSKFLSFPPPVQTAIVVEDEQAKCKLNSQM